MNEPNTQALEVVTAPAELPLAIATNEAKTVPVKQDAAQSRIEHVADLLGTAYQKASTLVLTPEEIAKLSAPFDDSDVCTGAGGDPNLLYLQHSSIRRRLASVFSPGQWALINRRTWLDEAQGFMYADCVLLIRGCYVGEAIGAQRWTPKNARMNYSDSVEGAQSEALRRIAGKYLDCGVQLWDKHYCEAWKSRQKAGGTKMVHLSHQNAPKATPERSEAVLAPTDAHRKRLIELLAPLGAGALEYCQKAGILMPTEELDDIPIGYVPATAAQKDQFMACVQAFIDGGEAQKPPYHNVEPEIEKSLKNIKKATSEGSNRIVGLVQVVSEKPGTNKKGKPYTKIGVKIADGWLNSFDTKIADICKQAKESGAQVDIEYKETEFGREILSCIPMPPQDELVM